MEAIYGDVRALFGRSEGGGVAEAAIDVLLCGPSYLIVPFFFYSDQEYIMGRQIWESSETFHCVTKGVPYPGLPKRGKPRLVELYYSSWHIRPGDGQLSACEVTLVHWACLKM